MAEQRNLGETTIISHLAKLYVDGNDIDLNQFVSEDEILKIEKAQIELEKPEALRPYFEYFEEKMSYDKIRFGLAFIERKHNNQIKDKSYSVDEIRIVHTEAYKKWDSAEDLKLTNLFNEGKKVDEIADLLGRNNGAITSRLKKLELK